jgi:hypothetical protein
MLPQPKAIRCSEIQIRWTLNESSLRISVSITLNCNVGLLKIGDVKCSETGGGKILTFFVKRIGTRDEGLVLNSEIILSVFWFFTDTRIMNAP